MNWFNISQVSAMKCGLLPISPEALSLGEVAYHDYHGILVDDEEKVVIQKNLGPKSKVSTYRKKNYRKKEGGAVCLYDRYVL